MLYKALSSLAFFATLPTPTKALPELQVFNLGVFVSSHPDIHSHIAFHVRDARSDHFVDLDCTNLASPRQSSIWPTDWVACDEEDQVAFWMDRGSMELRRTIKGEGEEGNTTVDVTDKQPTHWAESNEVSCANVTRTVLGTTFSRTAEWLFPLTNALDA